MGINLCAIEGMTWTRQDDGQLVSLTIHFQPATLGEDPRVAVNANENECVDPIKMVNNMHDAFIGALKNPCYAFLQVGESGVKIELSDNLEEFKYFNHYGFTPKLNDMKILKRKGVVGWTRNDTWYYIMQHDTWSYMNNGLRMEVGNAGIENVAESAKTSKQTKEP
jgi:hypothetical protein